VWLTNCLPRSDFITRIRRLTLYADSVWSCQEFHNPLKFVFWFVQWVFQFISNPLHQWILYWRWFNRTATSSNTLLRLSPAMLISSTVWQQNKTTFLHLTALNQDNELQSTAMKVMFLDFTSLLLSQRNSYSSSPNCIASEFKKGREANTFAVLNITVRCSEVGNGI